MFNVQNAPVELPDFNGVTAELLPVHRGAAQFDLSMSIDLAVAQRLTVEYSTDLFDRARIEQLVDDYSGVLTDALDAGGVRRAADSGHSADEATNAAARRPAIGVSAGTSSPTAAGGHGTGDPPRPGLERQASPRSGEGAASIRSAAMTHSSSAAIRCSPSAFSARSSRPHRAALPGDALVPGADRRRLRRAVAAAGWEHATWTSLVAVQPRR